MKKLIVVADWASDSLTCEEVKIGVEGRLSTLETPNIAFVASYPSTIHTAFLIFQLVEIEERFGKPNQTVLFQNTDTRLQTKKAVKASKGAEFIVIRLKSGMFLCGPNAGYDFSLIKEKIDTIYHLKDHDRGSQFRSRDLYSKVCAQLIEGREDVLEADTAGLEVVPDLEGEYVGHIDNYGNVKTTLTHKEFKEKHNYGESIDIEINGVKKSVKFVDNLFGGTPGELVIYPGSSGKKDNPFLEISVWRHFTESDRSTGIHAFNNPHPGEPIKIS
jgi:hypothetical protein